MNARQQRLVVAPRGFHVMASSAASVDRMHVPAHHNTTPLAYFSATTTTTAMEPVHLHRDHSSEQPEPTFQLQASANVQDRQALTENLAKAISATGGWVSELLVRQSSGATEATTVFVMENVGRENLAALHSLMETFTTPTLELHASTQRLLEDCYFALVEGGRQKHHVQQNHEEDAHRAILQLNWRV